MNWLFTTRKIPVDGPRHIQDQYLEFLTALGVPIEPLSADLGPWPGDPPAPEGQYVALVIGTSRPPKDWVPERWAALADALYDRYGHPMLVGGTSPREAGDSVADSLGRAISGVETRSAWVLAARVDPPWRDARGVARHGAAHGRGVDVRS